MKYMRQLGIVLLWLGMCNCQNTSQPSGMEVVSQPVKKPETVAEVPLPMGYSRVEEPDISFAKWLRTIQIKKDNTVYLYNGQKKKNQAAQYAVLDITVGKKDLQQCADAVMRLRAEYLFSQQRFTEIAFMDNNRKVYAWQGGANRKQFEQYLEQVFSWCGSASLQQQLRPVRELKKIKPGDVFIKGGFPGHAMIVVDVATNKEGKKVCMLAQSYMPAQDIHIVNNPASTALSPWFEVDGIDKLVTPEWVFYPDQLYQW
jgi:hypothetical protein